MNGRLKYADDLPYDARHSILMPRHHPKTKLLIRSENKKLGYGTGVEHFLCELRTRFWVPKGRRAVRSTVETCPDVADDSPQSQQVKLWHHFPSLELRLPYEHLNELESILMDHI